MRGTRGVRRPWEGSGGPDHQSASFGGVEGRGKVQNPLDFGKNQKEMGHFRGMGEGPREREEGKGKGPQNEVGEWLGDGPEVEDRKSKVYYENEKHENVV